MRWLACVIWVALAGCDGEDDFCDPSQTYLTIRSSDTQWIEYVDSDTYSVGEHGVAVGGTERYVVTDTDGCGSAWAPGPLMTYGDAPTTATVTANAATIDVKGKAPGFVTVHVMNDVESAMRGIPVRAIDTVRLVADEHGVPGAFFVGIKAAKIQLLSQGDWIVDRTLTVAGDIPQGGAWNLLDMHGAAVGDHALTVIAGDASWPVTATIVDHIDDIQAGTPTMAIPIYGSQEVCFYAHANGAVVAGVPWTFDYDTQGGEVAAPNCVEVWARDMNEKSTTVTAHALGMSATTTVTFTR